MSEKRVNVKIIKKPHPGLLDQQLDTGSQSKIGSWLFGLSRRSGVLDIRSQSKSCWSNRGRYTLHSKIVNYSYTQNFFNKLHNQFPVLAFGKSMLFIICTFNEFQCKGRLFNIKELTKKYGTQKKKHSNTVQLNAHLTNNSVNKQNLVILVVHYI